MKPKKKFKVIKTSTYAEEAFLDASSIQVARELIDAKVPLSWRALYSGTELKYDIKEVEEDADE